MTTHIRHCPTCGSSSGSFGGSRSSDTLSSSRSFSFSNFPTGQTASENSSSYKEKILPGSESTHNTVVRYICCKLCCIFRRVINVGHNSPDENHEMDEPERTENAGEINLLIGDRNVIVRNNTRRSPELNNRNANDGSVSSDNSSVWTIANNEFTTSTTGPHGWPQFHSSLPHQMNNQQLLGKRYMFSTREEKNKNSAPDDSSCHISGNEETFPMEISHSFSQPQMITVQCSSCSINFTDQEPHKKTKNWRCFITIVILCMCIACTIAALTLIKHLKKNKLDDYNKLLPRIDAFFSNCSEESFDGRIGQHICYVPNTSCSKKIMNKVVKNITISQTFSKHFKFVKKYASVVFSEDQFMSIHDGWVVDYNLSRSHQPLKIGKLNLTCKDVGTYKVTLQYEVGQDTSCKFDIAISYPLLNLSSTETDEFIHVSCELSDMCSDAYLTLLINDGNLTYPILADDEKSCVISGRSKMKEVALQKSLMASNHTITCKPITDDIELTENLTSTLSLCDGRQCSSICQEKEKGQYFQHPSLCNMYYQCEYPTLHLRPCPGEEQWNPEVCSCDFAKNVAYRCNNSTKRYINPLDTSNIKGCGGS